MSNLPLPVADSGLFVQKTGKISTIIALLCMAFFIKQPLLTKSYLYRTFREISKFQMNWQTRNWSQIQGQHFVVRYKTEDSTNAEMVLAVAEKSYRPVSQRFGYFPRAKTLIIVYPTKEALGKSFGWTADESAMGVYWAGVIRVLSPSVWVDEKNPVKVSQIFETEGPIAHEYTHLMVDYITGGNYTRWFTEGIAQYEEERLTGFQMEHRAVIQPEELYSFDQMDRNFDNLPDQNMAYYQSLQAIEYIKAKYGEDKLGPLLTDLGRGLTIDQSFERVFGISMAQFEKNFRIWLIEEKEN